MAEQPAGPWVGGLGHHRCGEQRQQKKEQGQHPAPLLHLRQDPQ